MFRPQRAAPKQAGQRGNILFLILLAVVLFAALSYAVTQSMRGGGNNANKEKGEAQAAEILNYFVSLDTGIARMKLTGNIQDNQLNFYYASDSNFVIGNTDNPNCTQSRCRVFDPAGGGVTGRKLGALVRDPANATSNTIDLARILYISIPGAGTTKPDIVFWIQGTSWDTCRAINKKFGISDVVFNVSDAYDGTVGYPYYGYPAGAIPDTTATSQVPAAIGALGTFCATPYASEADSEASGSGVNIFWPIIYHVLVAR